MHPRWTFLILPYTRHEFLNWGQVMDWFGVGWRAGDKADWKSLPVATVRGKHHGYLMKLDRSDWSQRMTFFIGRYYELGVLRTLDVLLRPGDQFVDIGANIGMITLHARSLVGAEGSVDCFEPNPACVDAIRKHIEINRIGNVVVHPCALADQSGSLVLKLTSEHSGTATLADVGSEAIRTLNVDVRVGDDVIRGTPRLIKIDVEGFELQVLRGLSRTLSTHKPFLITELIEAHLARAGTSVAEVSGALFDHGYEAYEISVVRRRWRHHLSLRPIARGGDFSMSTDVLWAHGGASVELSRHVRK